MKVEIFLHSSWRGWLFNLPAAYEHSWSP